MLLSWQAPDSDGGTPITDYIIEHKSSLLFRWAPIPKEATTATEHLVTGLKDKETYEFRVIAVNKAGQGKPSDSCKPVLAETPLGTLYSSSIDFIDLHRLVYRLISCDWFSWQCS